MSAARFGQPGPCHLDCGPIVQVADTEHAHENNDGVCWHPNDDVPEGVTVDILRRYRSDNDVVDVRSDLVAGEEIAPVDEGCYNHIEADPDETGVDMVHPDQLGYWEPAR